jgi:hypothetical protein
VFFWFFFDQDLARVRAPFSTPVHGHGARVLPSNGTLPGGAPAGWAVRGAHRAWPGAGGQRRPLSQLPRRSDRQRRIYSAGLPFKSCIESNSRQAYMMSVDRSATLGARPYHGCPALQAGNPSLAPEIWTEAAFSQKRARIAWSRLHPPELAARASQLALFGRPSRRHGSGRCGSGLRWW